MALDVRRGLARAPRWLPPKYFYDDAGCALFDRITALPEYYLTRAEEAILADVAGALVRALDPRDIVELGPGGCHKVRRLLDAVDHGGAVRYVPVDVGAEALARSTAALARDYPRLQVRPVIGEFEHDLDRVPPPAGRRLVLFLGSTIGNFDGRARRRLLRAIRRLLGADGRLLLGADLVKDRAVLEAAYNDAAGVTAEFNRNILRVVNRGLDGDFRPEAFRHRAFFDARASRIEMHLVASAPQRVRLGRLGLTLRLPAGEDIWTESSYKFTRASAAAMLAEASLAPEGWFTDAAARFALVLARPAPP
ncbi:MAG TPA: L-histidine N(alpha)-methyltransferase [Methylomirabilota bacterium]|nr:L-histidine N(alpha)-methyltransferase [Methylomirabilota bacterium]